MSANWPCLRELVTKDLQTIAREAKELCDLFAVGDPEPEKVVRASGSLWSCAAMLHRVALQAAEEVARRRRNVLIAEAKRGKREGGAA